MKKAAFLALVLVFGATAAFAHFPEGYTYFAVQFPDENVPTVDGSLEEDWAPLPEAYRITTEMMYEQLAGMGLGGTGVDLSDFAILLMVGWNETANMLYVGAQTYDNLHMVLRPTGEPSLMWQQDDLEIMIDIDHSGGQFAGFADLTPEESKRQVGAQATQFCYGYPNADGINGHCFMSATWALDPPYQELQFDFQGTNLGPGTTIYEHAIWPWLDLHWMGPDLGQTADLTEGDIVGLQFSFGDFDDPENPSQYHAFWTVSGQDETFKRAERFSDFMLAPIDDTIDWTKTGPLAVEQSTWGRIKASFTN
jgi:hypothetical protein